MVDVERIEVEPAVIDGQTQAYQAFIQTWAPHCGAPASVFIGQLNVVIHAELKAAGEDLLEAAGELMLEARPTWRALDRLLTDLADHLVGHDCYRQACLSQMTPDAPICPARQRLAARITRARDVLGLPRST